MLNNKDDIPFSVNYKALTPPLHVNYLCTQHVNLKFSRFLFYLLLHEVIPIYPTPPKGHITLPVEQSNLNKPKHTLRASEPQIILVKLPVACKNRLPSQQRTSGTKSRSDDGSSFSLQYRRWKRWEVWNLLSALWFLALNSPGSQGRGQVWGLNRVCGCLVWLRLQSFIRVRWLTCKQMLNIRTAKK